jgi:hypothetical protein
MVDSTIANATLMQFNAAVSKIQTRDKQMEELQKVIQDTQVIADQNIEAKKTIAELKKLNQNDREFVGKAFKFYEDITGEAVGINGLFNQEKETGKEKPHA